MERRRIITADEQDAYTGWRRVMCRFQRAGAVRKVKRRTHRRERREGYAEIAAQLAELPRTVFEGANRYDTDDERVLTLWARGESFDVRWSKG